MGERVGEEQGNVRGEVGRGEGGGEERREMVGEEWRGREWERK